MHHTHLGEGEGGEERRETEKDNYISILVSSLMRRRHYHLHLLIADLQEEQNGGHTLRVSTH